MAFQLPERSVKQRTSGLTSMIDFGPDTFGWTGERGLRDLLDYAAEYIDYAKIYAMNALLVPSATLQRVIGMYLDAGVTPYSGGILFEYAWQKSAVPEMLRHLNGLGIRAMEISENYISLTPAQRRQYIRMAQDAGLDVIYEFGRKHPAEPFDLSILAALVEEMTELGVAHTIIEQSEIDMIARSAPDALATLPRQPWFAKVLIEADPYRFPQQHAQLLKDFGTDVNLANITAGQCLRLEGLRRGVGRAVDYALLAKEGE